jgi:3-keto-5-aminohexanoate cleavage enzyme
MESDAVIVEVALNEDVPRTRHEHVPRRPNECALDAIRCAEAGAVVVHWHAIDAEGQPRLGDAALYGAALDAMDGRILAYPSYRVDVPATVPDRLGHCLELRARHQMELAPLDVATVNVFAKDAEGRVALRPTGAGSDVIDNPPAFVLDALARYRAAGLVPTLAAFDLGSTRAISALAGSGLLPEPVLLKIFLWESPIIGPRPSVEALDLHLRQLAPDLDVEWLVVTYGMTDPEALEAIARAALERGGGVRIGIGDSPRAFPDLSNPQMVELVVRWAADAGRPVAGLSAVRKRLGTSPVQGEAVP